MTATTALHPQYTSSYFFSGIDDKRYFSSIGGGITTIATDGNGMQPIELKCYSWDDFPVVIQSEYERESDLESERDGEVEFVSPPMSPRRRRPRSVFFDGGSSSSSNNNNGDGEENSRSTTRRREAVAKSRSASDKTHESDTKEKNSSSSSSSSSSKKSVRFAPHIEVRTHSIVLGDHPWCESGLPIELGWDVVGTSSIEAIVDSDGNEYFGAKRRLHSRSYLERKRLLVEVGGYEEEELARLEKERLLLDRYDHYYGDPLQFLLSPQEQEKQTIPAGAAAGTAISRSKSIDGLLSVISSAREA